MAAKPWNSVMITRRARLPSLRTPTIATGMIRRDTEASAASCWNMAKVRPSVVSASRPNAVTRMLSALPADCEMKAWRARNSAEWRAL